MIYVLFVPVEESKKSIVSNVGIDCKFDQLSSRLSDSRK
jgi:hypothetical protein